jgi:hypothetical protein
VIPEAQESLDRVVQRLGWDGAEVLLSIDGLLSIEGRNMLVRSIDRAKDADQRRRGQLDLTIGDKRTLQGEVDAGTVTLWVYACPDCGCRISDQAVKNRSWPPRCFECNGVSNSDQSLMDGRPMVPVEIPVRKLPDAFRHLDGRGVTERYIAKLARALDQQRQAVVPVRDVAFAHNARVLLRFAAARAGVDFDGGRTAVLGDGQDARVHFYADPGEGLGVEARFLDEQA